MALPPLIVITGPTGVGKTRLVLHLCRRFGGEIVGADSRQIYRQMVIGTAAPTAEQQALVPHHLVQLCAPDQPLSLADYQSLAYRAIDDIHDRGRVPFLVGGTALYINTVVRGLKIPQVPPNAELRAELEAQAAEQGHQALHDRLAEVDPVTAQKLDARNVRRVVRALEIYLESGQPKSELEGEEPPPYRICLLGLDMPRDALYARIDARVRQMVEQGLIEETRALLDAGFDPALPALTSLGYAEIRRYLAGELTREQAIERIQIETHRFVRHQYSWFRRMEGVTWFDCALPCADDVEAAVAQFLSLPH